MIGYLSLQNILEPISKMRLNAHGPADGGIAKRLKMNCSSRRRRDSAFEPTRALP